MKHTFERRKPDGTFGSQPIARMVERGEPSERKGGIIPGRGRRQPPPPPPPTTPPPGGGGVSQKPK